MRERARFRPQPSCAEDNPRRRPQPNRRPVHVYTMRAWRLFFRLPGPRGRAQGSSPTLTATIKVVCASVRFSSQVTGRKMEAIPVDGRPPAVEPETLATLVSELYPFKQVTEVKQLPSYDDRNFYFRATRGEKGEEEFVLKLFNSVLFQDRVTVEGQNSILAYLSKQGLAGIARPVLSRAGHAIEQVAVRRLVPGTEWDGSGKERSFLTRVVNYIPGDLLDKIDKTHVTPRLLYEVGRYAGKMDSLLKEFRHPGVDGRTNVNWDLMHFPTLRQMLPTITDPKKKAMFEAVLSSFDEHVTPKIPDLATGTIHGDINGLNIIVQPLNNHYRMAGMIDFGDCVRSCYLFELGIMVGYAMLEKDNPIPIVGPMISGYHDAFPLPEGELDCLYYVALARMCQSAVLGDHQYSLEPWNAYLLTTPTHAWRLIEEMLETSKDEVDRIWREARRKEPKDY